MLRRVKRIPIVVAALAIALSLAGCSGGNPTSTASSTSTGGGDAAAPSEAATDTDSGSGSDAGSGDAQELQIGQPVEVKQSEGTAKVTILSATYGPSMPGGDVEPVKHGGVLMLDVQYETADGVADANPLYFTIKSADGQDGELGLGAPDAISAGQLQPGEVRRGNIAFDVGAGPFFLKFWDDMLSGGTVYTFDASPR